MWWVFWSLTFWYTRCFNFCRHLLLLGRYVRIVLLTVDCPTENSDLKMATCFFGSDRMTDTQNSWIEIYSSSAELWKEADREREHSFVCKWNSSLYCKRILQKLFFSLAVFEQHGISLLRSHCFQILPFQRKETVVKNDLLTRSTVYVQSWM